MDLVSRPSNLYEEIQARDGATRVLILCHVAYNVNRRFFLRKQDFF